MKNLIFLACLMLLGITAQAQQLRKGFIHEVMNAGRVIDGKEIIASELPFTKGQDKPFTVMIVPKASDNVVEVEIVKARYYQGDAIRNIPLNVNTWNVTSLVEISADNATLFANYTVYVGFGTDVDTY